MSLSRSLILASLASAAGWDFVQSWLSGSLVTPSNRLLKLFRRCWGFSLLIPPPPCSESSYEKQMLYLVHALKGAEGGEMIYGRQRSQCKWYEVKRGIKSPDQAQLRDQKSLLGYNLNKMVSNMLWISCHVKITTIWENQNPSHTKVKR